VDVEAYFHHTTGLAAQNPNVRNPIEFDFENRLVSQGIDITLSKRFRNFNSVIFYTLSDNNITLNFDENEISEAIPANNHQRHNFRWKNDLKVGPLNLDATFLYRSGLPYSSPNDLIINDDDDYELLYDDINDQVLEPYLRLDLGLKYLLGLGTSKLELGINVQNVTNYTNIGRRRSLVFEDALISV